MVHTPVSTLTGGAGTVGVINPIDAVGVGAKSVGAVAEISTGKRIIDLTHPEYSIMKADWIKFRLTYEGGRSFLDEFLRRYSKAEEKEDFEARKDISYVPAYAKRVINVIRNALAVKMPEVTRKGDQKYVEIMNTNVDTFKSSMSSFMALKVVPLLLAQGKRFLIVDAPPAPPQGATLAEDSGTPFIFAVDAEDVQSWRYSDDGKLLSALISFMEEVVDPETGLVIGTEKRYKLYKLGEIEDGNGAFTPGIEVTTYDKESKPLRIEVIRNLVRLPIIELRLIDSLLTDISDMQIALMNLTSTDMSFLYRSNFPIYTEQQEAGRMHLKPVGSKNRTKQNNPSQTVDTDFDDEFTQTKGRKAQGNNRGRLYLKGLDRPDFIAPPVSSVEISLRKQESLIQDITVMADLALTSLSVKALEQSGKSKDADRIGEEAGLAYIATVLEGAERELGEIIHMFLGSTEESDVHYPTGYTIRTNQERLQEADALRKLRGAVNSPTYYRCVSKRIVQISLKQVCSNEELEIIEAEIDSRPYTDEDIDRAKVIQADVTTRILDRETAAQLRGYDEETLVKIAAEDEIEAQALVGTPMPADPDNSLEIDPLNPEDAT